MKQPYTVRYLTCPYIFFHLDEQKSDQISIADGTTGSQVVYNNGLVNVKTHFESAA